MSTENNVPKVSIKRFIQDISEDYIAISRAGLPYIMIPAAFIWGPPGVGKSQAVYQIAEKLEQETGKKVMVTDIRLSMFSPVDLRGVPVADAAREFTLWLKPKIFDLDPSPEVINLLFFDELSSATLQVQGAAYQITLDQKIGEHELPGNCIIIGAGNRTIDKSVVYRMPNALANRFRHYEVTVDFSAWRKWAVDARIHPLVLGYLGFANNKLCQMEIPAEQIVFPTPRSWVAVSNILKLHPDKKIETMQTRIAANVGTDVAVEFLAWCKKNGQLPEVEDIFCGRKTKYPTSQDALYALVISMVSYVSGREKLRDSGKGMKPAELENMARYASRFPADYQACLYMDLEKLNEDFRRTLQGVKLYKDWKRKTGYAA